MSHTVPLHTIYNNHKLHITYHNTILSNTSPRATTTMTQHHHFLLITYPVQGHINPSLQFAKHLINIGAHVTFATNIYLYNRLINKPTNPGLTFATFSDGYDDGFKANVDTVTYMSELKRRGSEFLRTTILSAKTKHYPITCLVYTLLLPWAGTVARELHLPSTLLWIQAATVFDIYYYYFHEYGEYINNKSNDPTDPTCSLELPGLPFLLSLRDLPSFLLPSNTYTFALPLFKEQLQVFDDETNPRIILVNTIEELEPEALKGIENFRMIPIGPLIKDPSDDSSFSGDVINVSNDYNYIEWLDSKPKMSVVYVSFGSLAMLGKKQMEEIARGLIDSGFCFLWVIREKVDQGKEDEELSCKEELEKVGKIVKWCSQVEVLSHGSLGCFVTHCGWNSTLESLVFGVPMVAIPQWTDQTTNAKLIEDVWKSGVRVEVNEEGIVEGEEIRKCLEVVMGNGEKGEEMRRNVKKWKNVARDAVKEGGSSDKNLRNFLDDIIGES